MSDGEVVRGHRHSHCYDVVRARMDAARRVEDDELFMRIKFDIIAADQGFVTSRGRFVGRGEAMRIQRKSGIPSHYSRDGVYRGNQLFSEDLY